MSTITLEANNELALNQIVPPPTIKSMRELARIRLIRMQRELCDACNSIPESSRYEVDEEVECAA
jgi:hypothetical protein